MFWLGGPFVGNYFVSLGNAVVDRSPDELIGAVIVALGLALAMAGLYQVGRRNFRENMMPMIALMIVANLLSMAVGAGYLAHVRGGKAVGPPHTIHPPFQHVTETFLVDAIFREADVNRDGLLSGDEASRAAGSFVRSVDPGGDGMLDPESLNQAIVAAETHRRGLFGRSHRSFDRPTPTSQPHSGPPPDAHPEPTHPRSEPDTRDTVSSTDSVPGAWDSTGGETSPASR